MAKETKLYKAYIAETKVDDDERTVTAIVSTAEVDRDNEVMLPKGANLENYLKNPVVQWAHDYSATPIARALWVTPHPKSKPRGLMAKMKFAEYEKADEIYQLFKGGFLNAFSVGFMVKKSHSPTPDEIKSKPEWAEARNIIDEWELLEFSAVPVPANPNALSTAVKSKSIALSKEIQDELGLEKESVANTTTHSLCLTAQDWQNTDDGNIAYDMRIYDYDNGDYVDYTHHIKLEPVLKPEETENYIRVPIRDCKITATITISAKEGIKALYCGAVKKVATYLFDKDKDWTMAKAKAWVKEHDSEKTIEVEPLKVDKVIIAEPVKFNVDKHLNISTLIGDGIRKVKGIMY